VWLGSRELTKEKWLCYSFYFSTTHPPTPWPHEYVSELDDLPELLPEKPTTISLMGRHWKTGQVGMLTEVSNLASHMAMPCKGHCQAVYMSLVI
jgi:hypothetical protein